MEPVDEKSCSTKSVYAWWIPAESANTRRSSVELTGKNRKQTQVTNSNHISVETASTKRYRVRKERWKHCIRRDKNWLGGSSRKTECRSYNIWNCIWNEATSYEGEKMREARASEKGGNGERKRWQAVETAEIYVYFLSAFECSRSLLLLLTGGEMQRKENAKELWGLRGRVTGATTNEKKLGLEWLEDTET